jgi:GNAT superfamily N-acetyltransferase
MLDTVAVPGGMIYLRPARPDDETFQFDLFRSSRSGVFRLGRLPDAKIDELLTAQFGSRMRSLRERFPHAQWSIIEFQGSAIGELIVDDTASAPCMIDMSLLQSHQRRGIGGAVIRALAAAAAGRGGLRAMVLMTNAHSLEMFRRLGFVDSGHDSAYVELRWQPPHRPEHGK